MWLGFFYFQCFDLTQSLLMSDLTFRPRFKFHSDMSIDEIADRLSQYAITNGSDQIKLKKTYGHFVLDIKEPFKHFW